MLVFQSFELVRSNAVLSESIAQRREKLPLRISGRFLEDDSSYVGLHDSSPSIKPTRMLIHVVVSANESPKAVVPWISAIAGRADVHLRISIANDPVDGWVERMASQRVSVSVDKIRDLFRFSRLTGIRQLPIAVAMDGKLNILAIVTGIPDDQIAHRVLSTPEVSRPAHILAGSASVLLPSGERTVQ